MAHHNLGTTSHIETECAILGVLMLVTKSYWRIADEITGEMFSEPRHQEIYSCIEDMAAKDRGIDIITVIATLREKKKLTAAGGPHYVSDLTSMVAGDANLEHYAFLVKAAYIKRKSIDLGNHLISFEGQDGKTGVDALDAVDDWLINMQTAIRSPRETTAREAGKETIEQIRQRAEAEKNLSSTAMGTGYKTVDEILGNFEGGELVIMAARPGMGKTAKALNVLLKWVVRGQAGGFVSLEMTTRQLMIRNVANLGSLENTKLQRGKLTDIEIEQASEAANKLGKMPMLITDKPGMSVMEIQAMATRWKSTHDIKILVIDYLQLIAGKGRSRNEEIGMISRRLKELAKSLDIPIVLLSQLNRSVEDTKDKIPQLHHLRDSGEIEQDADKVVMLWSPYKYGIEQMPHTRGEMLEGALTKGKCCVMTVKNRQGLVGDAWLDWSGDYQRFSEFTHPNIYENL